MAEAYECDRCGALHDGEPAFALIVRNGLGRSRPEDRHAEFDTEIPPEPKDLCQSCHNDLRRFYEDGGGDRDDVVPKQTQ